MKYINDGCVKEVLEDDVNLLKNILEFEYTTTDKHALIYNSQIVSLLNGKECTLEYKVKWDDCIYNIRLNEKPDMFQETPTEIKFFSDLFVLIFYSLYNDDDESVIELIEKNPGIYPILKSQELLSAELIYKYEYLKNELF